MNNNGIDGSVGAGASIDAGPLGTYGGSLDTGAGIGMDNNGIYAEAGISSPLGSYGVSLGSGGSDSDSQESSDSYNSNCNLSSDSGPCMAYMVRYAYSGSTGDCEEFVFGGCRGNSNNFETMDACRQTCMVIENEGVGEVEIETGGGTPYWVMDDAEQFQD
jgi:hypothetical protein